MAIFESPKFWVGYSLGWELPRATAQQQSQIKHLLLNHQNTQNLYNRLMDKKHILLITKKKKKAPYFELDTGVDRVHVDFTFVQYCEYLARAPS